VVDLPPLLWQPVLRAVILPLRPRMLVKQYAHIWRDDGSPLLAITREQRGALESRLARGAAAPVAVAKGMRYGKPGIAAALERLRQAQVRQLVVLPLYPQYSRTTTGSALAAFEQHLEHSLWRPRVSIVEDYHADAGYIGALAASVREHWAAHGRGDRLLMSFHGIPQRYADRGDPYERHCRATAEALARALGLAKDAWVLAYQSRVGRAKWLGPYTDEVIAGLAREGVRRLDVVCPGFAADCLETLEEIVVRYGQRFVAEGGEALRYVPALNARPDHIEALAQIVLGQLAR
jgi:protoporphyrin/coproporphyrin ferrochelatase